MSSRHYGIPPGHRTSGESRPPVSPVRAYAPSQSHELHNYPSPANSRYSNPFDSRHNLPEGIDPPTPPPHRNGPSSSPTRSQPSQGPYGPGAASYHDRDSPPLSRGGSHLNDVDNLYGGGRMMPPSPGPEDNNNPYPYPTGGPSQHSRQPSAGRSRPFAAAGQGGGGGPYDRSISYASTPHRGLDYDDYLDPREIADDGDDDFPERPRDRNSRFGGGAAAGAGAGAGAAFGAGDAGGNYGPVPGRRFGGDPEKSERGRKEGGGGKRWKWVLGIAVAVVFIAALVGGILGGVVFNGPGDGDGDRSSRSGASRHSDDDGLYDIDSDEVKKVLNNDDLHRVFPGMDYTPQGAQYPACLTDPPTQNDVTLDVAILAQLTPAIRLYGTDCNQTEMVLTAIDRLNYNDTLKVWMGVWLDKNTTTNDRQLAQMYDLLDTYPTSHFAGIIVGNEVLFREDLSLREIGDQLSEVRTKLDSLNVDIPVATADLGDDWTAGLANTSDIVMANVHPLFAGVTPDVAPGWTWDFWQTNNVVLAPEVAGSKWPRHIIAETGWPSEGGNNCGTEERCPDSTSGAVAGVDELNEFMDGWVCQAMENGTVYFWFEAYDEPWKEIFNDEETGDFWEPHWGLMDEERKLKDGVKIPDCGGKTVDAPY